METVFVIATSNDIWKLRTDPTYKEWKLTLAQRPILLVPYARILPTRNGNRVGAEGAAHQEKHGSYLQGMETSTPFEIEGQ